MELTFVACDLTQQTNDKQQLAPMLEQVQDNLLGERPEKALADSGYYSDQTLNDPRVHGIDLYVPPDRQKHDAREQPASGPQPFAASTIDQMRSKLRTPQGREVYKMRKAIVEPVFGHIKDARGLRRFLRRGSTTLALSGPSSA